jgi:hypothetical protein
VPACRRPSAEDLDEAGEAADEAVGHRRVHEAGEGGPVTAREEPPEQALHPDHHRVGEGRLVVRVAGQPLAPLATTQPGPA